jgi:hypothetical protein
VPLRPEGAGLLVTRLEDLDAGDLRAEKDDWTAKALLYAREYRAASQSGEVSWEHGVGIALDQALAQVRRIDHLLKLGVAA